MFTKKMESYISYNNASVLHWVCQFYPSLLKYYLDNINDINYQNKWGETPLFIACKYNPSIVDRLLKNGANPNIYNKISPLHVACRYNPFLVEKLLKHYNIVPHSCLQLACRYSPNTVELLLNKVYDINDYDEFQWTALSTACYYNPQIVELLLKNKANPNIQNRDDKKTPIHIACYRDFPETVELLIKYGSKLNFIDKHGETPLHFACEKSIRCARILLNNNALIDIKNNYGQSPLHLACEYNQGIVSRLIDLGADVKSKTISESITPLHYACSVSNQDVIIKLLEKYNNVNEKTSDDITALHIACLKSPELIPILLKYGADPNSINYSGSTSLHIACEYNPSYIKILLDNGANPSIHDKYKIYPLRIICKYNYSYIPTILKYNPCIDELTYRLIYQSKKYEQYLPLIELYCNTKHINNLIFMYSQYYELKKYTYDIHARLIMQMLYGFEPYDFTYEKITNKIFNKNGLNINT